MKSPLLKKSDDSLVLCVAINASFVHSSASARVLRNAARDRLGIDAAVVEFSLGEPLWKMAEAILVRSPQVVGLSVHIWNRDVSLALVARLRAMEPQLLIVLGGPEVWFEEAVPPGADVLVRGEGESHWCELLRRFFSGEAIRGMIVGDAGCDEVEPPCLDIYRPDDAESLRGRFAYLETSRGCPFRCGFCLSGRGNSRLRLLDGDVARIVAMVELVRSYGVRTVKFLDRTFNANPRRAVEIWRALASVEGMGFHFEVEAALLDDAALEVLAEVPAGRFQFEIGVQSLNRETLRRIGRRDDVELVLERLGQLLAANRVHVHADLIWGLPAETRLSLEQGFNRLFAIGVHELQIGFLKMLPGTAIRTLSEEFGYRFEPHPPYEVVALRDLPSSEMRFLRCFEHVFNIYANSRRFSLTIRYLLENRQLAPFDLFAQLAEHFRERALFGVSLGVEQQIAAVLERFPDDALLRDYLLLDYVCNQNVFTIPRILKYAVEIPRTLKDSFKPTAQTQLVTFIHELDCENLRFSCAATPGVYLVERLGQETYAMTGARVRRLA